MSPLNALKLGSEMTSGDTGTPDGCGRTANNAAPATSAPSSIVAIGRTGPRISAVRPRRCDRESREDKRPSLDRVLDRRAGQAQPARQIGHEVPTLSTGASTSKRALPTTHARTLAPLDLASSIASTAS